MAVLIRETSLFVLWATMFLSIMLMPKVTFAGEENTVAQSNDNKTTLTVKYIGSGYNQYWLLQKDSKTLIWKSFWGVGQALFSTDLRYMALVDSGRFDVMGPVLIFKLDKARISLVYQSPANFNLEETRIGYELEKFTTSTLYVRVLQKLYSRESSRAHMGNSFVFQIDCKNLRPITPSFFPKDDRRFFNINNHAKAH